MCISKAFNGVWLSWIIIVVNIIIIVLLLLSCHLKLGRHHHITFDGIHQ